MKFSVPRPPRSLLLSPILGGALWLGTPGVAPVASAAAPAPGTSLPAVAAERWVTAAELAASEARFSALTNQLAIAQQAQQEITRKLQAQLAQLERQAAAPDEQTRKLLARITELETKLSALEHGRVLPEITLPAEAGPTVQELDQKIRITERKLELAEAATATAAETRAQNAPRISLSQNGFAFSSADTNFVLRIRGLLQLDSRTFFGDNALSQGNDGFFLRRARPIIEGTLFRDLDYQFVPEFGGNSINIVDAKLNYRLLPGLQVRAGKFKGPVGLEQLLSDATLPFNERSLASDLVPQRNLGVQLWGTLADERVSYAAGVFNAAGDGQNSGNNSFSDDPEFAGRIFLQPFKQTSWTALKGFGLGVGGSFSQVSSNALALPSSTGGSAPGYSTPGPQQFFAYNPVVGPVVAEGNHWRLSPQASYTYGPFGLLGEYVISDQGVLNSTTLRAADLQHTAWQVSGQWVLTGEPASFTGLTPRRPFRLRDGGPGAWQLVGRFGRLDLDDKTFPSFANAQASASSATSWSVGLNWWLNQNLRVLTSFTHTTFDGGGAAANPANPLTLIAPATVTAQDENVLSTRVQLSF